MGYKKILVPLDFSEHSARALDTAIELAQTFGATLELLHCTPIQPAAVSAYGLALPQDFDLEIREAAARELVKWREKANSRGVEANSNLSSMTPSLAIPETASELGAEHQPGVCHHENQEVGA